MSDAPAVQQTMFPELVVESPGGEMPRSNGLTDVEIHAHAHWLVALRVRSLIDGELEGRRLVAAREMLAFTVLGHARQWPWCAAGAEVGS